MIKQVYDLTEDDLNRCHIWQFLSEDDEEAQDEASIKECFEKPNKIKSMFIVSTIFKFNDGSLFRGFVYDRVQSCSQFDVSEIIGNPVRHAAVFNNACCLTSDSAFI